MSRIMTLYFIVLLLLSCSSQNTENNKYKTVTWTNGAKLYSIPDSQSRPILAVVPFKGKVEIVDEHIIKYEFIEFILVSYNHIEGYINKSSLSDKQDIPFVENTKYNFDLSEFSYDKEIIINHTKKILLNKTRQTSRNLNYFYINDPQIFTFYSKDCNNSEIKRIAVIVKSRINKGDDIVVCFDYKNKQVLEKYIAYVQSFENELKLKEFIDYCKTTMCCGNDCD